jgi:hypothetical protein
MSYPRTVEDLGRIYDTQCAKAPGFMALPDFHKWATAYLLNQLSDLLDTPMNAHGETLETILTDQK